ncbi:MAG: 50S ribosomal protein L11 methyltransferase [Desulfuromonadales bacterium]|jgi:ribosomal protein L11 methyltransferase|nr:50S ribosomal protein L11 methyltransferase [Desulfuromonadales bacterium]
MTNKWLEMRINVPDQAVDLVSQALMELGCTGITAAEKALDTFVVPSFESLANDPVLRAYFIYPESVEDLCLSIRQALSGLEAIYPELVNTRLDYRELADHDWASDWQQHFPPFKVGKRLVIHPSWIDWPATGNEAVLTLDPGQAFGTGTHATTGLCLEALSDHFETTCPPQRVLDVGTGSGILAMAAAALGAKAVVACDIDSDSCQVAAENVRKNRLSRQISITDSPLDEIPGQYDLVLANILAGENIRLAAPLVQRLAPQGRLVLSGILIEQEQQVIAGFAAFPLTLLSTSHRDEWTCIVYQRHE